MAGAPLPDKLRHEGRGMLGAAAVDFTAAGYEVASTLDPRAGLVLPGRIERIDPEGRTPLEPVFDRLAGACDATLVIAPECEDLLGGWLERLEKIGARALNCDLATARLLGDKLLLADHLRSKRVPVPRARAWEGPEDTPEPPYVIKPRFGVGCAGVFRSPHAPDPETWAEPMIAEPWVAGRACSVTFLASGGELHRLAVADQHFDASAPVLAYRGGSFEVPGALAARAERLARRALATLGGLSGILGVDLVLGEAPQDDRVIEVNPRATVTYAAVTKQAPGAVAAAWLAGAPPEELAPRGRFDVAGDPVEAVEGEPAT